jgi:hypothetical protein
MTDSLEGEIEERGNQVRVRLRACSGIYVVDAFRETFGLVERIGSVLFRVREFLPREFRDHPEVQRELFDPIEEIWRERLRF